MFFEVYRPMAQPTEEISSSLPPQNPTSDASRTQSIPLTSGHVELFTSPGVGLELLVASGVRSVTDQEAREFGFELSSASSLVGILFPYLDPVSGQRVTARLRRDYPDVSPSGKTERKYLSPYGDNRHLYFGPGAPATLTDTAVSAVFVEAEKSALALTALAERKCRKFLVIATGGCWGWRGKIRLEVGPHGDRRSVHGPLPDLDRISLSGRDCYICFDANCSTNSIVRFARIALAEELVARGAYVRVVDLPLLEFINGPDDLIAASGDEAMLTLLDSALPFARAAELEADAALVALEEEKDREPASALDAIATVPDPLRRSLLLGRFSALRIPGLTRHVVEKAVEQRRNNTLEKHKEARELAHREHLLRLTVRPAKLICDLETFYSRRRYLPADAAFVEALFCLNTHVFELFDTTPYLLYESATGGCGKTTSLEYHEAVCARAYLSVDPSAAALYRKIDRDHPTWLLDEAALLQSKGDHIREMLAIFDAGYKAGATVSRCEDHGEGIRDFNVFCPKVLSRIGGFRGTLLDRGIVIHLEKSGKLPQTRRKILRKEAAPLRQALEAYALQYSAQLQQIYECEPEEGYWPEMSGREEEIWGPLLIHARLAGKEIEHRAVKIARHFSGRKAEIAIAEDGNLARTQETLEVLGQLGSDIFSPNDLMGALSAKETWGVDLADRKSDKARVSAVGKFISSFRLPSRKHTATGTHYNRLEAIEVLRRHTPTNPPTSDGVNLSPCDPIAIESISSVDDTSDAEVSSSQPAQTKEHTALTDTLAVCSDPRPGEELHFRKKKIEDSPNGGSRVPKSLPGVRILGWNPKQAPIALDHCAIVTNSDAFIRTTLDQLRIAVAEPKRWVGWTVDQLIARLRIVGVEVAVGSPNRSENGIPNTKVLEDRL
jgi:uncharacterized protein DUF3854